MLTRMAAEKALPSEVRIPNRETFAVMLEARDGKLERFDSVEALLADLHAKD